MAKSVNAHTAGFKCHSERANELVKEMATKTQTHQFLQITTDQMYDTEASQIAKKGFIVMDVGINFNEFGYVATNAQLEKILRLSAQRLDWRPEASAPPLTRSMAEEMGCLGHFNALRPGDTITQSITHPMLNKAPGKKAWIIRMQERLFLRKSPSSVSAQAMQILYQIYKAPWKTLGYWKNKISVAREDQEGSLVNLLMAYVLVHSTYGTEEDRARLSQKGPSATRTMIQQNLGQAAVAPPRVNVIELEEESEEEASELDATELSSDEEEVEGFALQFGLNLMKQMDSLKIASHALQIIVRESRTAIKMGLKEVIRLNKMSREYRRKGAEISEELHELQSSFKQVTEREEAHAKEREKLITDLKAKTAQLRTENLQHVVKLQAGAAELRTVEIRETLLKAQVEGLQKDLEKAKEEEVSAARELAEMRRGKEAQEEEKRAMELRLAALEAQLADAPLELMKVQEELRRKEEEVRLGAQAKEQTRTENESLRVVLEKATREVSYWKSQGEIVEQLTTTPEKRKALLTSTKKRKTEGGRRGLSEEEIQQIVGEAERKLEEGLGKQVTELQLSRSQVQQSVREMLSGATSQLDPKEISVEGYYQVMSLLVDMYRLAVGITAIALTDREWVELLHEMPLEGKIVIPRMLVEAKLRAENPHVCHVLLGGLLNAHTAFMMNAQEWAMEPALTRPIQHKLEGEALTEAQLHEYEEQSAAMLQAMEESRGTATGFSIRLGQHEARQKPQYGIRRMNYAFCVAGWETEGKVTLGEMQIPPWAIDYTFPAPTTYVAGLIPIDCPDSYEMRILEKKIDIGQYLPYEQLMEEIDEVKGAVWDFLGPSDDFLTWLEDRDTKVWGSSIFGTDVPAAFCAERKRTQCPHTVPMWNRDATSPSIFVGGVGDGPVLDTLLTADRPKLLVELRSFFMSFHRGNANAGALRDPRMLVAYAITKGLAMLLSIDWRVNGKFEKFEMYKAVHSGGWTMYQCACSIGPRMVRWLSWAGRTGYLPGIHAALVHAVDGYTTFKMMTEGARDKRSELGFIPTATECDKHHEIPRHLPLPPRERSAASGDEPWELFWEEREEWRTVRNAAGWEAAVTRIKELRDADYQRRFNLTLEFSQIDKDAKKPGNSMIERCNRHPDDDEKPQEPKPKSKLSKGQRKRRRNEQLHEIENAGSSSNGSAT